MREMKNSGIAWIGDIPSEWELKKGKFLFAQRNEKGNTIELQLLSPTQKYGVIPQSLYEELSGMKAVKLSEDANLTDFKSIYTGDFCISLRSFQGGFEYALYNGVVSPAYQVFYKITKNTFDGFYKYMFKEQGFIAYMTSFTKTFRDGKSISFSDFANSLLPLPPFAEQKRIAEFLDNQCAEIDTVIEKTKATIEEYKKLKQSVITQAVTKGIRPNRPMKDSGIEWIGEIPADWEVKRGKAILTLLEKPVKETDSVITCFRDGQVTLRSNRREDGFTFSLQEVGYQGIDVGDLVVHGMDGFAGAIGISDSRGKGTPVLNVMDSTENKRYIMYYLRNMAYNGVFIALATGIRVRSCDTNWNKLKNLPYIIPSHSEQQEIVDYIDRRCSEIDELIAKKTSLLSELESYKKSLIYEYVTGKKEV